MTKSEFYLKWYSESRGEDLNSDGYPNVTFKGGPITTEELWTDFLSTEPELDFMKRHDKDACELLGGTFTEPHESARNYPEISDQLDSLYHDIDDGKLGADAKTGTWYAAVKKVKDDTPKN